MRQLQKETDALRSTWNGYVFARNGFAPGAGMEIVPEQTAYEALCQALHRLLAGIDDLECDETDEGTTFYNRTNRP